MKATDELIEMAEELTQGCRPPANQGVAFDHYERMASKGRLLIAKLGKFGAIWAEAFAFNKSWSYTVLSSGPVPAQKVPAAVLLRMYGAAEEILHSLQKSRFRTIEEMVSADVLGDMREHADELFQRSYFLASAIVLRVVLEERLRLLCQSRKCAPAKPRATIDDYNQALYKHGKETPGADYSKTEMQWVTSMAGIANEAAHGTKVPTREDTERLSRDVDSFLAKFSP